MSIDSELFVLEKEHRRLDTEIIKWQGAARLRIDDPSLNVYIRDLKKRKLLLRDRIKDIRSEAEVRC